MIKHILIYYIDQHLIFTGLSALKIELQKLDQYLFEIKK